MVNKKIVEAYFLQKTGGTYTEQSVLFLFDLLRREGILSNSASVETLTADLATLVRDGSHLEISTKRLPEHIRAQIDFSLQKTKKTKNKSRSSSQSAFDDLLASLDSDDPRFTMDTTMGLEFGSMEDLEADLKRRALDSLSPTLFKRITSKPVVAAQSAQDLDESLDFGGSGLKSELEERRDAASNPRRQNEFVEDFEETVSDELGRLNSGAVPNSSVNQVGTGFDGQYLRGESQGLASGVANGGVSNNLGYAQNNFSNNSINSNNIPLFPNKESMLDGVSAGTITNPVGNYNTAFRNVVPGQMVNSVDNVPTPEQHQVLSDLRLRTALIDAKERIMSQRLNSLHDPIVLRALSMLDEKAMQLRPQILGTPNKFVDEGQNRDVSASHGRLHHNNDNLGAIHNLHINHNDLHRFTNSSVTAGSPISQVKSQIEDIISLQKALSKLNSVAMHSSSNMSVSEDHVYVNGIDEQKAERTNVVSNPGSSGEVKKLRSQVSSLQNQLQELTGQIKALVGTEANVPPRNSGNVYSSKVNLQKIRPMRAVDVPAHELLSGKYALGAKGYTNYANKSVANEESRSKLEDNSKRVNQLNSGQLNSGLNNRIDVLKQFTYDAGGSESEMLQKMYSLLSVGLRELAVVPKRAKHIYEQLQKNYTLLSAEDKQIIYPSIITFHAMVSDALKQEGSSFTDYVDEKKRGGSNQ